MKYRNIILTIAISVAVATITVFIYAKFNQGYYEQLQESQDLPVHNVDFRNNRHGETADFTNAISIATPAVVHIQTKIKRKQVKNNLESPFHDFDDDNPFEDFLNEPSTIPEQRGGGSGVILSKDGYIVTNNHVIKNADEITVTLANHKKFKASVIGTNAKSDLAVIKINANSLPFLPYGNSDEIYTGQWVLAIGYPFNLDATVTAGIVSGKARITGNKEQENAVQSFIQTDAAINFGSSGGALVNSHGKLIGINTAFISPTGSYAGYSYAIPVNIVKNIVNTLIKYGSTQKTSAAVFQKDRTTN
ncbi:MAG TPA: trypsin-like peptidase domain-containing protein [Chitinophagaceae bacterium]|jgi:S1-C subfamily serine protease